MTRWSSERRGIAQGSTWLNRIVGLLPFSGNASMPPLKTDRDESIGVNADQVNRPSFPARLRWRWADPDRKQFFGYDVTQKAIMMELMPADVEARDDQYLDSLSERLTLALRALPESDPPWVLQVYVQDEPIRALEHEMKEYAQHHAGVTKATEAWLSLAGDHLSMVCNPNGLFVDPLTDLPWRGRYRRVRAVLYRKNLSRPRDKGRKKKTAADELHAVGLRLIEALREAGVTAQRLSGDDFRAWMLPWLTGEDGYEWMEERPYPTQTEAEKRLPAAFDLAEIVLRQMPVRSDTETGTWTIGQQHHRFLTLDSVRDVPRTGLWTLPVDNRASAFDRLPEGTMLVQTFIAWPQDLIEKQINAVSDASMSGGTDAVLTSDQCAESLAWMAQGNRLYGMHSGLFLRAPSAEELEDQIIQAQSTVAATGLDLIEPEYDVWAQDSFVRSLPWGFDPELDRKTTRHARLCWDSHGAAMLPVYGRGTGTGNPGILWFNRLGEPFTIDPLNHMDRQRNAHLFMFGPTGSGKTATLIAMLMQELAYHRPRVFIVTALPTFGLLADWCESVGLSVNHVRVEPGNPVSLPPFSGALSLLDDDRAGNSDGGDLLGQMEIAARLMITGGEAKEEDKLGRAEKTRISDAILNAARTCRDTGRNDVLPEDVSAELARMADEPNLSTSQRETLSNMAMSMRKFCTGFAGDLFNRPGESWPDADITIIELGTLTRRNYEDLLAVSMVGLMNRISDRVEANQHSGRQTIALFDEAHKFLQNPLISPYMLDMGAMWRTYGGWIWIATQNLHQFPPQAKPLLNQPEWWICLSMDPDQVEQIVRFKTLTPEEKLLLLAARKQPQLYTEGVVMADAVTGLFRVVPPSLALALAQTEQHEKAERARIMKEHHCSELDAAYRIAAAIDEKRQGTSETL